MPYPAPVTVNAVTAEFYLPDDAPKVVADIVVANILTNPLCVLAPLIAARVAPGGHLALSVVLETQAEQVIAAYAPHIALGVGASLDGWVRLEGRKA